MAGGGSSLAPYFNVGNKNNQNLHLNSSNLRPDKALEEVKNLEASNLDLTIEKPELKIQDLVKNQNEKENIETIYQEINKELEVLKIEGEKDEKWKELVDSVKKHRKNYLKFVQNSAREKIRSMLKEQKRISKKSEEKAKVRIRRFSVDNGGDSEEFNILEKIGKIKNNEKESVVEFYKSYLKALTEKNSLFEKLKKIDENIEDNKKIDTEKFQSNITYFEKSKWLEKEIDLSKNNQNDLPPALLPKSFLNLMESKFNGFEKEIQDFGNGIEWWMCTGILASFYVISSDNACNNRIRLLRGNQNILKRTVEFKILLQLLKDMDQLPFPSFEIIYEEEEKNN